MKQSGLGMVFQCLSSVVGKGCLSVLQSFIVVMKSSSQWNFLVGRGMVNLEKPYLGVNFDPR